MADDDATKKPKKPQRAKPPAIADEARPKPSWTPRSEIVQQALRRAREEHDKRP